MYGDGTEDHQHISYRLRNPRGWYESKRASQLSGIPRPTLYDWRRHQVFVGDYPNSSPMAWSYRDLVLLRLLAWLRQGKMERQLAAEKIEKVRSHLNQAREIRWVHATRREIVLEGPEQDRMQDDRDSILPFTSFFELMRSFDMLEPIKELRRKDSSRVWAPDLVRPSPRTRIVPWVLAGEPCIERSRVPTSAVFALSSERGLDIAAIVDLYPSVSKESVADSIALEGRLRHLNETAIRAIV